MRLGIAAEHRILEKRVVLLPEQVKGLAVKNEILVETGAGMGIGIADSEYEQAGAKVVGLKEVYQADLVVRIKEPNEEELKLMRPGQTLLMSMLHLESQQKLAGLLKKYKISAIALEELKDQFGRRRVEALHQTGYIGMEKAFELWGQDPRQAVVKIMGYGNVACGAIQAAARKLARVIVLNKKDIYEMKKHIPGTDILVNAIKWPQEMRGKVRLVTRKMLKLFKKGAVLLDLISDPEGQSAIETSRPTKLDEISYVVDGVIHASVWGWPGLDPVNVSKRYSLQLAPIIKEIAEQGIDNAPEYIKKAVFKAE